MVNAEQTYEQAVGREFGFVPRLKLDREGMELILKLREVMGEMKPPLPSPDQFIDESYYREAVDTLTSR